MENYTDFLYHHGVQGMKWGVWNDETRARRLGIRGKFNHNMADSRAKRIAKLEGKKSGNFITRNSRARRIEKARTKATRNAEKVLVREAKDVLKNNQSLQMRDQANRIIAGEDAFRRLRKKYGNMPNDYLLDQARESNRYDYATASSRGERKKAQKERSYINIAAQGKDLINKHADEYVMSLVKDHYGKD